MYEFTPLFYATPCMVKFLDLDCKYHLGIGFKDSLIDLRNGEVFDINQYVVLCTNALRIHFDKVLVELKWTSLDNALGDLGQM